MDNSRAGRQLLFALIAMQNSRLSLAKIIEAFASWSMDPSKDVGSFLVSEGVLAESDRLEVEAKVAEALESHFGQANRSTASMASDEKFISTSKELAEDNDSDRAPLVSTQSWISERENLKTPVSKSIKDMSFSEADRFRIVKRHAQGGLGVVFLAEDRQLRRDVALKQIRPDRAHVELYQKRFLQEAEVTGRLEHPGIVPVYALGKDERGNPFYAMRFISGETLQDQIRAFHQNRETNQENLDCVSLRQLLRRLLDVCNAMSYAHAQGILHRDLKPNNIMLGKYGETLIVDWGLAKYLKSQSPSSGIAISTDANQPSPESEHRYLPEETRQGAFLGTLAYAPPEQLLGNLEQLSYASDVYSVGAILYQLLTSQPPLTEPGLSCDVAARKIAGGQIHAPRQVVPSCPKALEAICSKAMAAKMEDRYSNMESFKHDLESWLDDGPIQAFPDSTLMKLRRWMRRHPKVMTIMSTAAVFAIVQLGTMNRLAASKNRQIEQQRLVAVDAQQEAEAVSEFLTKALQSSDPDRGGEKITVAEVLRSAEAELVNDSKMSPERKIHLASVILDSLLGLSLSKDGIRVAEYMNKLCDEAFDDMSVETLMSRCHLGTAYIYDFQSEKCIQLLEENLPLLKDSVGDLHEDVLSLQNILGCAYGSVGRSEEGEKLLISTWNGHKQAGRMSESDALVCLGNLAAHYLHTDRKERAIEMTEEALAEAEMSLGPDHSATLLLLQNLGSMTDDNEESLVMLKRAYEGRVQRLGESHVDTCISRNELASVCINLERWEEALPLWKRSLEFEARSGAIHSDSAESFRKLIVLCAQRTNRYEEAEEILRQQLLPENPLLVGEYEWTRKTQLSFVLLRQDRPAEALTILDGIDKNPDVNEVTRNIAQSLIGEAKSALGKRDDARSILEEAYLQLQGKDLPLFFNTRSFEIAAALTKLCELDEDEAGATLWRVRRDEHRQK